MCLVIAVDWGKAPTLPQRIRDIGNISFNNCISKDGSQDLDRDIPGL